MPSCWGITDGSAGMVAQVRALALALGLQPEMKKIIVKEPWVYLPNMFFAAVLRPFVIPHLLDRAGDRLDSSLPDVVISCGRRAAIAAMGLKVRAPKTIFIHIQDPQMGAQYFDLVVAMAHDRITGANVIKTRFALHTITPTALAEAQNKFVSYFSAYRKPLVAVLFGGSTNKYRLSRDGMAEAIAGLLRLIETTPCSLLVTPSRRTGEDNIAMLKRAFDGNPRVYIYDFAAENPYLGLLALADYMVVTNDSVNMMSEAAATGKPLYILPLPGHTHTKPARFAENLIQDGIARPLGGKLETWDYSVENDMAALAADIRRRVAFP